MSIIRRRSPKEGSWNVEIFATILSLLSLLAILILLTFYNGKPLFHWHQITLNAIISVFATLSRLSLLVAISSSLGQWRWNWFSKDAHPLNHFEVIDDASRGTLGSIRLLWITKSCVLVAVGAWITIGTIAFDPFVQQILSYRSFLIFDGNNAHIASAERYSAGTETIMEAEPMFQGPDNNKHDNVTPQLDLAMQSAVLYGLSANSEEIMQQTPFKCPSGNCRWAEYLTLAICSSCADISKLIITTRSIPSNLYLCQMWPENDAASTELSTIHTLPNGLYIANTDLYLGAYNPPALLSSQTTFRPSETLAFRKSDTLLMAVSILRANFDEEMTWTTWQNVNVTATECALYLCLKRYSSEIVNGTLVESSTEIASTRSTNSWQTYQTQEYPASVDALYEWDVWLNRTDLTINVPDPQRRIGNITAANVSQVAIDTMISYLNSTFVDSWFSKYTHGAVNGLVGASSTKATGVKFSLPAVQPFWASPNLNTLFSNIAGSMSSRIRANSDGSRQAYGQAGTYQTFIQVRWAWISLPCVCVGGAVLFLLLAIWDTRRREVPLLKNSALGTLFHGLDYHTLRIYDSVHSQSEIEKAAQDMMQLSDQFKLERASTAEMSHLRPLE